MGANLYWVKEITTDGKEITTVGKEITTDGKVITTTMYYWV